MTIDTSREAVERLLTDVTPGPWYSNEHGVNVQTLAPNTLWRVVDCGTPADASFIAASRELVPALLAERDAAEAREQALLTSYDEERKALVENASLRERLKAAEELLQFIAEVAPVADETCDVPGITFVEACRREMKERRNAG